MLSYILYKIRREPALLVGFVSAVLVLLTSFGVSLSDGQQAAIIGVIIAIGSLIVRDAVTPNVSVGALEDDQGHARGDLMAGQASEVPDGDPVNVVLKDDDGAVDIHSAARLATICIAIGVCGFILLLLL